MSTLDEEIYRMKLLAASMLAYADEQKSKAIELLSILDDVARRKINEKDLAKYIKRCRELMQYEPNGASKN